MSRLFSILVVLILTSFAQSEVNIPSTCRVRNKPNGYCTYASMEIIGRFYKDERLYGLVDHYSQWESRGAGTREVKSCLDHLGVEYKIYEDTSLDWLKYQVDNGIPVIVGCHWGKGSQHAIIIVDLDNEWVKYIDSNDIHHNYWVDINWFKQNFTGWSIVIEKR
ncbi:hypothetical protein C4577_02320 [Candidatus Parcubacteria bacterium]|nr:MAG: hypothetical protein C4577_02320 [Candidatus Parcubacteria bacterium]